MTLQTDLGGEAARSVSCEERQESASCLGHIHGTWGIFLLQSAPGVSRAFCLFKDMAHPQETGTSPKSLLMFCCFTGRKGFFPLVKEGEIMANVECNMTV